MYGKLFESTFTGSLYGKGAVVFAVWGYVIAHTKPDGLVELNPALIAGTLGAEPAAVSAAIAFLSDQDPASRTKTADGRRLLKEGEYLYRTVNYAQYNSVRNEPQRREYNRIKQQESRARRSALSQDVSIVDVKHGQARQPTHAVSVDSDSDSDSEQESGRGLGKPVQHAEPDPKANGIANHSHSRSQSRAARAIIDAFEPSGVAGLDAGAWARWVAYRQGIGHALRAVSLAAAARGLAAYGADQAAVVEQSIGQGWQGLFALKAAGGNPIARARLRTADEIEADEKARGQHGGR